MTDKITTILEDSHTPPEIAQIAKNTIQAEDNKHLLTKVSNIKLNFHI